MIKKSKSQKRFLAVLLSAAMAFTSVNMAPLSTVTAYAVETATIADGDYYIMNVGKQQYLNSGNEYGTRASCSKVGIPVAVTKTTDAYTLKTNVKSKFLGRANGNGSAYMDVPADYGNLKLTELTNGNYTICYDDTYLTANSDDTVVDFSAKNTGAYSEWIFVSPTDYRESVLAEAYKKVDQGKEADMTSLLLNPGFESGGLPAELNWTMVANNKNLNGGATSNRCGESWHSTFELSQTLTGIPNGVYEVAAQGFYRQDDGTKDVAYIYANDVKGELNNREAGGPNDMNSASAAFSAGKYAVNPIEVVVTDNQITLGAETTSTSLWVIFDNFSLKLKKVYSDTDIALLDGEVSVSPAKLTVDKTATEEISVTLPASVSANDVDITYTPVSANMISVTADEEDATKAVVKGLKAGTTSIDVKVKADEVEKEVSVPVKVEETDIPVLVSFDFDEGETTDGSEIAGVNAKAIVHNSGASLVDSKEGNGKAIKLTSGNDYLELVKEDGGSILTDKDVITISYDLLAGAGNWNFFAAKDASETKWGSNENYFGSFAGGTVFERYKIKRIDANTSSRVEGVKVPGTGWNHFDVVVTSEGTWIYVNGELGGYAKSPVSLSSMLGKNSVLYLGKATWGANGEYGQETIDNFTIYDGVLYQYAERVFKDSASVTADETIEVRVDDETKNVNAKVVSSTKTSITYTSSDETKATVDDKGNVTAVKEGTATITTTIKCGKETKTAKTAVTVKPLIPTEGILAEEGITVTESVKMLEGETADITVKLPSKLVGAEGVSVSYNSLDESVATVSANTEDQTKATITGVKKGVTKIRAYAIMGQTMRFADTEVKVTALPTTSLVGDFNFEDSLEDEVTGDDAVAVKKGLAPYAGEVEYDEGHNGKAVKLGSYGIQLNKKNLGKEFTVSTWLKATNTIATNQATIFLGYHSPELWAGLAGDKNNTYKLWSKADNIYNTLGTTPVSTEWKQYTIVGSEGKIALYVDGKPEIEGDCKEVLDGENQNIYIGVTNWDTPYAGLADDVKVYNDAFDADEVFDLYLATATDAEVKTLVGNAVEAIGEVAYTDTCKAAIEAAEALCAKLSDEQKVVAAEEIAAIDAAKAKYADLKKAAEDKAAADKVAADAAVAKINAIGTVTLESKATIDAAKAAYEALTAEQKELITAAQLKVLTDAEAKYAELKKAAEQAEADKAAADAAVAKINAIGTVTLESKATIDVARAAYDALTEAQKKLVTAAQLKSLTDAEAKYEELKKAAEQAEVDKAAADAAVAKINAIGAVAYTDASKAAIDAARVAYDALTEAQKELVTAAQLKVLTDAEAKYAELKKAAEDKAAADAAVKVGDEKTVNDLKFEVVSADKNEPQVAYTGTTKANAKNVSVPATVKVDGVEYKVTEIKEGAFKNAATLRAVRIPSSVTTIGKSAFEGCKNLRIVTIPSTVTKIDAGAFKNCKALYKVTIPTSVTEIADEAFMGCSSLETITIPSAVTSIGAKAFYNCREVEKITIKSKAIKKVGKNAFKKINKACVIKVPGAKKKAYKKLFKKGGLATSIKVK